MSNRSSIWIVNHYASTPDQGAGTRHYDFGRRLTQLGHDVTIFASGFSHFSGRDERVGRWRLWRTEWVDGVRFVWLRTVPYRGNTLRRALNMASFAALLPIAQLGFNRPDVVVGSTVHPLAALAASVVAALRKRPFVFEIRDLWPQTLVDMGAMRANGLSARLLRWLEGRLVQRADAVIALLPGVRDYLKERGLPVHHVEYIPNGVDTTERAAKEGTIPSDVVKQINEWRSERRFIVAYVGSHGRANGLGVVLEALERLGGVAGLLMVGAGPEKGHLQRQARGSSNVRFFDPVPKTSVGKLLESVDACLFHLADTAVFRYGISSNKLFDYLAHARPVVFACRTSYDPVREAGAGESVPPEDPQALADAIKKLASQPTEYLSELGERGRRHVFEHHSVDHLARRFAAVMDGAMRHPGS